MFRRKLISPGIAATVATLTILSAYWLYSRSAADERPYSLRKLIAAVGANRLTEARLTGGFAYGPYKPHSSSLVRGLKITGRNDVSSVYDSTTALNQTTLAKQRGGAEISFNNWL